MMRPVWRSSVRASVLLPLMALLAGCGGGSSSSLGPVPGQVDFPETGSLGPLVQGKVLGSPFLFVKTPRVALTSLLSGTAVTLASAPVDGLAAYKIRLPGGPDPAALVPAAATSLPAGYTAPEGTRVAVLQVDLIDDANGDNKESDGEFVAQSLSWFALYATAAISGPAGQPSIPQGWSLVNQPKDTPVQVVQDFGQTSIDIDLRQLGPYKATGRPRAPRRLFWAR